MTNSSIRRTGLRLNSVRTNPERRTAHGSSERTRAAETQRPLPYLICTRQTKNQYEKAIKPSMNRTENQFSRLNSTCVFGPPLKLRAPQASQYPS